LLLQIGKNFFPFSIRPTVYVLKVTLRLFVAPCDHDALSNVFEH